MRSAPLMTLPLFALGTALAVLSGCASQASTSAPSAGPNAATETVVIRPVTQSGVPAPGYSVTFDDAATVDCGTTSANTRPSPVAVDGNILSCSPSSAYAVACWQDPAPSTVICYRDPWKKEVVRMPNAGGFPEVAAPSQAQPLGLLLSDGDRCRIRTGGVWSDLADHPGWYGTYACSGNGAVWADSADGIDRSSPRWTVQVAPISGDGPLTTRGVTRAYLIGTETGPGTATATATETGPATATG